VLRLLPPQEDLDDAHTAAAAGARMLGCFWLLGLGIGGFDGIDRDEWHCEQLADTGDVLAAGRSASRVAGRPWPETFRWIELSGPLLGAPDAV